MNVVENVLIALAVLGAATFCVAYPLVTDFRRWTREGVHMWGLTFSLLTLGAVSLTRRAWGEWPGYDAAVAVIYGAIAALLWQRVLLLYIARREVRALIRERLYRD